MQFLGCTRKVMVVLAATLALHSTHSTTFANAKVEEQVVSPAGRDVAYAVSQRGVHVASVSSKGSRYVVTVDGAPGPLFDQMLTVGGQPFYGLNSGIDTRGQLGAILFNPDGTRHAYCGREGENAIIVVDGKEFARVPYHTSVFAFGPLTFSPQGKHFYYAVADAQSNRKFFMDGKELPLPADGTTIVFSPDDARYVYTAADPQDRSKQFLVVDGERASYFGVNPRFTGDSKHLVCMTQNPKEGGQVLSDGQPIAKGQVISQFFAAPATDLVLAHFSKPSPKGSVSYLVANGTEIDCGPCMSIDKVVFSPDGKRYAALCQTFAYSRYIVADGKRGREYQGIDAVTFSPDSSKLTYAASNAGKTFVVLNDAELDESFENGARVVFSADGARMTYTGMRTSPKFQRILVVDGKVFVGDHLTNTDAFTYSPDGSRFSWVGNIGMGGALWVDGKQIPFIGSSVLFSPDSKHAAFTGQRTADGQNGLFVDNELVHRQNGRIQRVAFTPDSNHVYWMTWGVNPQPQEGQPVRIWTVYLDGKPVAKFDADTNAMLETAMNMPGGPVVSEIAPDGTLTVLAIADNSMKRIRVTPTGDSSIASAIESVRSADAKAKADAEEAKAKALADSAQKAADTKAANEKAAADAAKAREDQLAARQKAMEEKAAARKKALDDAAAARKKALDDAAAAKKAKATAAK